MRGDVAGQGAWDLEPHDAGEGVVLVAQGGQTEKPGEAVVPPLGALADAENGGALADPELEKEALLLGRQVPAMDALDVADDAVAG